MMLSCSPKSQSKRRHFVGFTKGVVHHCQPQEFDQRLVRLEEAWSFAGLWAVELGSCVVLLDFGRVPFEDAVLPMLPR